MPLRLGGWKNWCLRALKVIALSIVCLALPAIGAACSCPPLMPGQEERQIQAALERSEIVFRGEIIAHKWHAAVFRVQEQWKGNLKGFVKLRWRRGDRGDCNGFWPDDLKVGNELLVFATKGHFKRYRTSICLPTRQVSQAEKVLAALGPGKPVRPSH